MGLASKARSLLLAGSAIFLIAACTQGEEIASPGASSPGSGGSGGGGTGGGGTGGGAVSADVCPSGLASADTLSRSDFASEQVICDIAGTLLSDLTLPYVDTDNDGIPVAYRLSGRVDVGVDTGFDGSATGGDPAVLNIAAGVTVFGESGSDYLVVNRGSRIEATGTEGAPIVFTSRDDLEAGEVLRPNATGEWGGLVILGQAPINKCSTGTLGTPSCSDAIEGVTAPDASFGGGEATDNSGTLRYVQVRHAGFPLAAGDELNGISFGGVGSSTIVDYVQVHNNSDDGIEMFGGTANLKHIVLTGNDDDSLDTDHGWSGNVQYIIVAQADGRGDNGFEMSSSGSGVTPATNPTIANFTIVSTTRPTEPGRGMRLNTGHIGRFINGVVTDSTEACVRWDDPGDGNDTYDGAAADPTFNSVLFSCPTLVRNDAAGGIAAIGADANNVVGPTSITTNYQAGANEVSPLATPIDANAVDSFFETTAYLGAFGPDETETNNWATGWTFGLFSDPGCPTGTSQSGELNGERVCLIPPGTKNDDLLLTRGNIYELDGRVDIGTDVGFDASGGDAAVLTIEPGVTIFGNSGSDYLVVNRGSQIRSNGTLQNPVIMTSEADLNSTSPSLRLDATGEWGGVVILGRAPINKCSTGTLGTPSCSDAIEGVTAPDAAFGGGVATDNSGSIMYTRVMFAGFPLAAGDELNGISFGGVGSSTIVDNVQVHNNSDDGIEMFGGTVNLKHIVLTGNDDDSLDTDHGWNGNVQYIVVKQRDGRGDNGFEMSSSGAGVTPATNPTIANYTIASTTRATEPGRGQRLNTGHIGRFINGIVTDTTESCIRWDDPGDGNDTYDGAAADPTFENVLFDCPTLVRNDAAGGLAAIGASASNDTTTDVNLINGFINDSAAAGVTPFSDLNTNVDSFFENTGYIGAVENSSDDWYAGWTCGLAADDC